MGLFSWLFSILAPKKGSMRRIAGLCDTPGEHTLIAGPGKGKRIVVSSYVANVKTKSTFAFLKSSLTGRRVSIMWSTGVGSESYAPSSSGALFECEEGSSLILSVSGNIVVDYEITYEITGA